VGEAPTHWLKLMGAGMFQGKGLRRLWVALIGIASASACSSHAASLKVENATGATNARSQELAATLILRNASRKTIQAFIMAAPSATDDVGHAYTSTGLGGHAIGGIAVCARGSHCLGDEKEKTESTATLIEPDDAITLTIAFCCKVSGGELPSKASAGIVVEARESADGQSFGAWRSLSVGAAEFAVTGKK
jgi:hypothetical protein